MPVFNPKSINTIFQQPSNDGRFDGEDRLHLRRMGKQRRAVILAFPPKAAGTYFRTAVIAAVEGQLVRTVHAQGGRDAQLYLPTFLAYFEGGITNRTLVSHVHMQALPANVNFLEAFDIRPIIMMRSVPDMLASYWDMLDKDEAARADGLNGLIPENWAEMSRQAKADFMVDAMGGWYASYFATWLRYAEQSPDRVCVLTYREFCEDPVATLEKSVAHVGMARSREACERALGKVWEKRESYRYNKGQRGRGAEYFGAEHYAQLRRMLGHYKNLAPHMDMLLPAPDETALRKAS